MERETFDLLIVGAGPAGLAVAIRAAMAGMSAAVVDHRTPPLDKACGEGLMPPGVALLASMGVRLPRDECHPLLGVRFIDGPAVAEARFVDGGGLGLRRVVLSAALRARAGELGVQLLLGCRVRGFHGDDRGGRLDLDGRALRGRYLVAADGLHSPIRRALGLDRPARATKRFGLRRHCAREPWSDFVEVWFGEGAEAYVTPLSPRAVGVALLAPAPLPTFDELLGRFPVLAARLGSAAWFGSVRGAGPFEQRAAARWSGRVALVGDAAGYLDPITGEGLTLALRSAELLVENLRAGAPLSDYDRAWIRLRRPHLAVTRLVLLLAAHPGLRRRAIEVLARRPEDLGAFLSAACGGPPRPALGLPLARTVLGFLGGRPKAG